MENDPSIIHVSLASENGIQMEHKHSYFINEQFHGLLLVQHEVEEKDVREQHYTIRVQLDSGQTEMHACICRAPLQHKLCVVFRESRQAVLLPDTLEHITIMAETGGVSTINVTSESLLQTNIRTIYWTEYLLATAFLPDNISFHDADLEHVRSKDLEMMLIILGKLSTLFSNHTIYWERICSVVKALTQRHQGPGAKGFICEILTASGVNEAFIQEISKSIVAIQNLNMPITPDSKVNDKQPAHAFCVFQWLCHRFRHDLGSICRAFHVRTDVLKTYIHLKSHELQELTKSKQGGLHSKPIVHVVHDASDITTTDFLTEETRFLLSLHNPKLHGYRLLFPVEDGLIESVRSDYALAKSGNEDSLLLLRLLRGLFTDEGNQLLFQQASRVTQLLQACNNNLKYETVGKMLIWAASPLLSERHLLACLAESDDLYTQYMDVYGTLKLPLRNIWYNTCPSSMIAIFREREFEDTVSLPPLAVPRANEDFAWEIIVNATEDMKLTDLCNMPQRHWIPKNKMELALVDEVCRRCDGDTLALTLVKLAGFPLFASIKGVPLYVQGNSKMTTLLNPDLPQLHLAAVRRVLSHIELYCHCPMQEELVSLVHLLLLITGNGNGDDYTFFAHLQRRMYWRSILQYAPLQVTRVFFRKHCLPQLIKYGTSVAYMLDIIDKVDQGNYHPRFVDVFWVWLSHKQEHYSTHFEAANQVLYERLVSEAGQLKRRITRYMNPGNHWLGIEASELQAGYAAFVSWFLPQLLRIGAYQTPVQFRNLIEGLTPNVLQNRDAAAVILQLYSPDTISQLFFCIGKSDSIAATVLELQNVAQETRVKNIALVLNLLDDIVPALKQKAYPTQATLSFENCVYTPRLKYLIPQYSRLQGVYQELNFTLKSPAMDEAAKHVVTWSADDLQSLLPNTRMKPVLMRIARELECPITGTGCMDPVQFLQKNKALTSCYERDAAIANLAQKPMEMQLRDIITQEPLECGKPMNSKLLRDVSQLIQIMYETHTPPSLPPSGNEPGGKRQRVQ